MKDGAGQSRNTSGSPDQNKINKSIDVLSLCHHGITYTNFRTGKKNLLKQFFQLITRDPTFNSKKSSDRPEIENIGKKYTEISIQLKHKTLSSITAPLSAGNALPLFDFARFAMNLTWLPFLINHFLVRKHSVSPSFFMSI